MANFMQNWKDDPKYIHVLKEIQRILKINPSGVIDEHTMAAVKNFQLRTNIPSTGLLDQPTFNMLLKRFVSVQQAWEDYKVEQLIESSPDVDFDGTTDLSETIFVNHVKDHLLPDHEYIRERTDKKYIFIHHTAGWENPYGVIDSWANDTRGRIGTHYVVGGINIKTNNAEYDGEILRAIPDEYWGYHLGGYTQYGISPLMQKQSISIELCNFGYLVRKTDGFFYTYTGQRIDKKYVCDLSYKFRGYQYWHKYTDMQIESLRHLLTTVSNQYNIDLKQGLIERLDQLGPAEAFGWFNDAVNGRVFGLLSHTSVRKDKTDVSPQPNLINMLRSL